MEVPVYVDVIRSADGAEVPPVYVDRIQYVEVPVYVDRIEYVEVPVEVPVYVDVTRPLPADEILRRIMIPSVEYIMFGPDIGVYNEGISNDAEGLNELALNHSAQILRENPSFLARIEGHANPVTNDPNEADELMALSSMRANQVAQQLRVRGVREEQMVIIAFGGTRTITSDHDIRNRNRRVELTIIQIEDN